MHLFTHKAAYGEPSRPLKIPGTDDQKVLDLLGIILYDNTSHRFRLTTGFETKRPLVFWRTGDL